MTGEKNVSARVFYFSSAWLFFLVSNPLLFLAVVTPCYARGFVTKKTDQIVDPEIRKDPNRLSTPNPSESVLVIDSEIRVAAYTLTTHGSFGAVHLAAARPMHYVTVIVTHLAVLCAHLNASRHTFDCVMSHVCTSPASM